MLTFGDLQADPFRLAEVGDDNVLIAASAGTEVVVREVVRAPEATVIFQHETIAMMRAERAEQLDKLRRQLGATSVVIPIRKKPGSFWDQITVGRASTSDIVLEDPAISNVHAHFELDSEDRSVSVQDLASSNGTFVNRERLQPHSPEPLRTGDCLRFGQTVFYFVANGSLEKLLLP